MFQTFIPKLLDMTLTASVVICAVLLLRLCIRKAPKVISYALWALVLFRLLCPVSVQSDASVFSLVNVPAARAESTAAGTPTAVYQAFPVSVPEASAPAAAPAQSVISAPAVSPQSGGVTAAPVSVSPAKDSREIFPVVAGWVWLAGAAGMLAYCILSYLLLRRRLRTAVPVRDNIYAADGIGSPFVVGLLRPRIYLPVGLNEAETEYILLHEQLHIRRLDHVFKLLAFLALTVHWFNPLVWLAFILASKDMEMSCDEAVIRRLGSGIRAAYSASLLTFARGRRVISGTPLAFGEGDTSGRIKNISKWKKPALWIILAAVAVCIAAAVCLLSDPKGGILPDDAAVSSAVYAGPGGGEAETALSVDASSAIRSIVDGHRAARFTVGLDDPNSLSECVTLDFTDGTFYTVHYQYYSGYSLFRGKEDDYRTIVTKFDESGKAVRAWRMEYSFDEDFVQWRRRYITRGDDGSVFENAEYYLTVGEDGVKRIKVSAPGKSGGCENADGSLYRKGDRVRLELLDGLSDLRGVSVIAMSESGRVVWAASVPDIDVNRDVRWLARYDGWSIEGPTWENSLQRLLTAKDYEINSDSDVLIRWTSRSGVRTDIPDSITVDGVTLRAGMTYADVLDCGIGPRFPERPVLVTEETGSFCMADFDLPCGERVFLWFALPADGRLENGTLFGVCTEIMPEYGFDYGGIGRGAGISDVTDILGMPVYAEEYAAIDPQPLSPDPGRDAEIVLNYASAGGGYGEADFFFRPGGVAVRQIRFFTRIGAEVESTFESNEDMRGALSFVMTMVNYYDPDKLFRNCYWQLARDEDGIWRMGRIEYEPGTEDADGGREEEGLLRKLLDAGDYEIRADEAGYTEWIARSRELTPDPVSGSITVDGVTLRAGMTYADVLACGLEAYYPEYPLTSSRETESEYIRVAEMKLPCGEKIKVWLSLPAGGEHDSSDQSMIENGVLSGVQTVGVAGFGFDYRGFTSASSIGDVLDAFGGSPYAALESADEIVIQFAAGGASDDVEYEDIIFTFTPDGSAVTDVAFYVQRRYENAAD